MEQINKAKARADAAAERAGDIGGNVPTLAIQRWGSARWVEVELDVSE